MEDESNKTAEKGMFRIADSSTSLLETLEALTIQEQMTNYVLYGLHPDTLADVILLDDNDIYGTVTETSVSYNIEELVDHVESVLTYQPAAVAQIHTHPTMNITPSNSDKNGAEHVVDAYRSAGLECRILQGIHGRDETEHFPDLEFREPSEDDGVLHWLGETRSHKFAPYDETFEQQIDVAYDVTTPSM